MFDPFYHTIYFKFSITPFSRKLWFFSLLYGSICILQNWDYIKIKCLLLVKARLVSLFQWSNVWFTTWAALLSSSVKSSLQDIDMKAFPPYRGVLGDIGMPASRIYIVVVNKGIFLFWTQISLTFILSLDGVNFLWSDCAILFIVNRNFAANF